MGAKTLSAIRQTVSIDVLLNKQPMGTNNETVYRSSGYTKVFRMPIMRSPRIH